MKKLLKRKPKEVKVEEVVVAEPIQEEAKAVLSAEDYVALLQQQASVKAQLKILKDQEEKNKALLDAYVDDETNKNVFTDTKRNRFFRFTDLSGAVFYYKREHRQSMVLKEDEAKKILTRKKLLADVLKTEVKEVYDEKALSDLFSAGKISPDDIKEMYAVVSKGYASKVITEKQKEEEDKLREKEASGDVEVAEEPKKRGRKKKEVEEMPVIEQESTSTKREKGRGRKK